MAGIIYTGVNTKLAHGLFVGWLNAMINNYVSGFYDDAISNIIKLSFIRPHNAFMNEVFDQSGKELRKFITVIPTDSTQNILMIHGMDGVPTHYNKTDIANIFTFSPSGILTTFYENIVIPIYDASNTQTHELFITFEDLFGIKAPMLKIKNIGSGEIELYGFLDLDFEERYSGSYNALTVPFDDQPYFLLTNITKMVITADIPILPNLTTRYSIPAGQSVSVPVTDLSDFFIRTGINMDSIKFKLMQPN